MASAKDMRPDAYAAAISPVARQDLAQIFAHGRSSGSPDEWPTTTEGRISQETKRSTKASCTAVVRVCENSAAYIGLVFEDNRNEALNR